MSAVTRRACGVLSHAIAQPALQSSAGASLDSFTAQLPALSTAAINALHPLARSTELLAPAACARSGCTRNCATCRGGPSAISPSCSTSMAPARVGTLQAAHYMSAIRRPQAGAWQAVATLHGPQGAGFARRRSSPETAHCSVRASHSGGAKCGCIRCSFHRASWQESGKCGCIRCSTDIGRGSRPFSTIENYQEEIDAINDRFTEARDEIETARDDAETTYFNESYTEAQKATEEVLAMYAAVLASLSEVERARLQRSMGLKIEQLKAEFSLLDTLHD